MNHPETSEQSSHETLAIGRAIKALQELRVFTGAEDEFWGELVKLFSQATGADHGEVLPDADGTSVGWAATPDRGRLLASAHRQLIQRAATVGSAMTALEDGSRVLILRLETAQALRPAFLILQRYEAGQGWEKESLAFLQLFSDTPKLYQQLRRTHRLTLPDEQKRVADVLEIQAILNTHRHFETTALALVNELCARFSCDRVSLGWIEDEHARLKSVSHMDRVEKHLEMVHAVESVMEECYDQNEEILWPLPDAAASIICRQHENFSRKKGLVSILSIPLRVEEKIVAVMTFERSAEEVFSREEILALILMVSQCSRRMWELERNAHWLGKRLYLEYQEELAKLWGPEHTLLKLAAIGVACLLAFLFFFPWPYKVAGTFSLKTKDTVFVPAPFDGYLQEVSLREGDTVLKDQVLLELDQRSLQLELEEAQAELNRFRNEKQVALSSSRLSDMRSSEAQEKQVDSRLKMIRMNLEKSIIRAPYDGVIVESKLHERLGRPIQKGEVLFRIAKLDGMYAEVRIPEQDIEDVNSESKGALAFASRPEFKYRFLVERINPAAQMVEEQNVFIAKIQMRDAPELWWRPGMTGVAKIRSGFRPPIWIITHEAVDTLRLKYLWF